MKTQEIFFLGLPIYPYYSYAQKKVAEAIVNVLEQEPLNFVINVGHNFYFNGVSNLFDSRFEDSFEQVYEDPKLLVPWFTIAGNHGLFLSLINSIQ